MKKLSALLILCFIFFSSIPAYSASEADIFCQRFVITGGINTGKNIEATFNKSRTISGTAEVGSVITIKVFSGNKDCKTYKITVGSSGYFSQSVDLFIGENLIVVTAEKGYLSSTIKANIKRKKSEIKSELSKNISFPSIL